MAFDVSTLPAYTAEDRLDLLHKTLYGSVTMGIIDKIGQIIPGIKTAEALPILESTLYPQAGGCGFTTSGSTAITERVLTVKEVKFAEELCPSTLETKFTQKGLDPGHPENLGVFAVQIGEEKAANVADWIEDNLWNGDASNTGEWDGFKTILDDLGFGDAGDPVDVNTAGQTTMTIANVDEAILATWAAIPARVKSKQDVVAFMGLDTFDLAVGNLVAANMYHFTASGPSTEMVWPGTRFKLIGVPGLNGTNVIIAGRESNFYIGTDLRSETEQFKQWWSEDDQIVKMLIQFKLGTQFAFPNEIAYFKLD